MLVQPDKNNLPWLWVMQRVKTYNKIMPWRLVVTLVKPDKDKMR
jgi:hypothetical protein